MATNGDLIRTLRTEAGWSLRQLATAAQVNPGYLSRVENGKATPSIRWVAAVAAVWDIPPTHLLLPDQGDDA